MSGYDLLKQYRLQGHSTLASDIDALVLAAYKDGFDKGQTAGCASQAILEQQGRSRFMDDLRKRIDAGEKV